MGGAHSSGEKKDLGLIMGMLAKDWGGEVVEGVGRGEVEKEGAMMGWEEEKEDEWDGVKM